MALYHSAKGSVDYTTVGAPTIVDGIASGFSASNYLQISQTYNATNDKNVEIYVRAKTPTTITSGFNPIFGAADNIGYWGISSFSNALFTIRMGYSWSSNKSFAFKDMYISGGIQADTWYRFKIKGNNGIWRAEIYNDSGTLLNSDDKDWSSNTLNENYTINLKCTDNTGVYSGAIDLKQTYIKIEGQPWFGVCPVEVKKHQIMGPVGYTVVGSPTITDGIVSDFSYDNYFKTAESISTTGISSFEFYARVKTPSAFANGWCRICHAGSFGNQGTTAGIFGGNGGASPYFHLFGIDIWQQLLTTDTWYRIQYLYSPSSYTATIYDDNGNVLKSYTYSNPKLNLQGVINFCQRYENFVLGAIDLNNTYIKVNGKMWFWQPQETKYIQRNNQLVWVDQNLYLLNTKNGGNYAGNSVYFNSGFVPTNKTTYEVMFDRMNSTDSSGELNCSLFGVGPGVYNNTTYGAFRVILQNRLECTYFGTQAIGTISGETLKNGKRKVIKSVLGSNYVVTLTQNGTTLDTLTFNTVSDQTCFGNLYLGCYNYGYSDGRNPIPFYPFLGKIYYAKFWENGVLIRHFVPVPAGLVIGNFTVPSNGMFDMVNQQFYANLGRGEFTIGRDE